MNHRFTKGLCLVLFCICFHFTNAQNNFWKSIDKETLKDQRSERLIIPDRYEVYSLDFEKMKSFLDNLPTENERSDENAILTIPMPDKSFARFSVRETPVFSPGLAKKYPGIKSFSGQGIDQTATTIKFGYSHKGFHALILSGHSGSVYIDNYAKGDTENYISYYRKDYSRKSPFTCDVEIDPRDHDHTTTPASHSQNRSAGDCQLRTYRLAIGCTGEYADFHGGTKPDVLAEYNVAMTRVNGIYERDNTITMILVDNTDEVIYLDPNTDPYTNNQGGTMLGENQATLDDIIGTENYDIGHAFSTGGGGIASLRAPCVEGRKARGITGLANPINDPFYVDYVSHEMGHQFGGNHTQNNNCNRSGNTAVEPGSGNTIMGYAGICAPNTQNNSDDHFHAVNMAEIANFVTTGAGADCPVTTPLENNPPVVNVESPAYIIPGRTPFALTVIASDMDGDSLTYCWEQMDTEVADMPPSMFNTGGPAFRSNPPVDSPTRYFPNIFALVNNLTPTWEVLPAVDRTMGFRCTVRDNNEGAGCTAEEDVTLTVHGDAGPFLVTHPNTAVSWNATDKETITWDVAGTDLEPINSTHVDILLSTDGGMTYNTTIVSNVPNTGSYEITVPDVQTNRARLMVRGSGNIFFDISDEDFTVTTPFTVNVSPFEQDICPPQEVVFEISTESFDGFDEMVSFSVAGLPQGASASFSTNPVSPPESSTLTLSDFSPQQPGTYLIQIIASTPSVEIIDLVYVNIGNSEPAPATLIFPSDGMKSLPTTIEMSWDEQNGVDDYLIEISERPDFSSITESRNALSNNYYNPQSLESGRVYYWRVRAASFCTQADFSKTFAFQTASETCLSFSADTLPITISDSEVGVVNATLSIDSVPSFEYIKTYLMVQHTWLGDLKIDITSPSGSVVSILDQPGVPNSQFGCNADNIDATFFDAATITAEDLESACETIAGEFQPVTPFETIEDEQLTGMWTLTVEDFFDEDGGSIDAWDIQFCSVSVPMEPDFLNNQILYVNKSSSGNIDRSLLEINDSNPQQVVYSLLGLPASGTLEIDVQNDGNYVALSTGSSFTQEDINNNLVRYTHNGNDQIDDAFVFDAVDSDNNWVHAENFRIFIVQEGLSSLAELDQGISCHNANDAIISINAFGGLPPYSYSIDGGMSFQEENIFENLSEGTYEIIVRDDSGAEITSNTVDIINPPLLTANATLVGYDIIVETDGGTGTLMYSLDSMNYQDSPVFEMVGNGSYKVYVKDENGCETTSEITVLIEALSGVATISKPIDCFDNVNGEISVLAEGGVPTYEYSIDGAPFQADATFTGLAAGAYSIRIKDSGGLIIELEEIVLENPEELLVDVLVDMSTIEINASGGTGTLFYSIDDGMMFQEEHIFTELPNGEYFIIVRDEFGCEKRDTARVMVSAINEIDDISSIEVYPNPADKKLSIDIIADVRKSEMTLHIHNSLGQVVMNDVISLNGLRKIIDVDVSNLVSGTYSILIRDKTGQFRTMFIKM